MNNMKDVKGKTTGEQDRRHTAREFEAVKDALSEADLEKKRIREQSEEMIESLAQVFAHHKEDKVVQEVLEKSFEQKKAAIEKALKSEAHKHSGQDIASEVQQLGERRNIALRHHGLDNPTADLRADLNKLTERLDKLSASYYEMLSRMTKLDERIEQIKDDLTDMIDK